MSVFSSSERSGIFTKPITLLVAFLLFEGDFLIDELLDAFWEIGALRESFFDGADFEDVVRNWFDGGSRMDIDVVWMYSLRPGTC